MLDKSRHTLLELALLVHLVADYATNLVHTIQWDSILKAQKEPMSDEMMSNYRQFISNVEGVSNKFGVDQMNNVQEKTSGKINEVSEWFKALFN